MAAATAFTDPESNGGAAGGPAGHIGEVACRQRPPPLCNQAAPWPAPWPRHAIPSCRAPVGPGGCPGGVIGLSGVQEGALGFNALGGRTIVAVASAMVVIVEVV